MAKTCTYCGAMNSDTAIVCKRCKKALKGTAAFGEQSQQKQIKNTKGKKDQRKNVQKSIQSGHGQQQFQKDNKLSKRIVIPVGILAFIVAAFFFLSNFWANNAHSWESKIERSENGTEGLEFTQDKGSYVVTGYSGVDTEVLIPNSYQGIPVTKIKSNAFKESNVQSVGIGKNVTVIEKRAFKEATLLQEVYIGAGVREIEESVFEKCMLLSKVEFARDSFLDSLGDSVFKDCTGLEKISIENCSNLHTLGAGAFMGCKKIKRIDLKDCEQLNVIESYAFAGCAAISEIAIPASVSEVGHLLFYHWKKNQKVVIMGDASIWKLYRDGGDVSNPFAKNENRSWMAETNAEIIYKAKQSNNLLNKEEQYELLEKNIMKIINDEIGEECSFTDLSKEEKMMMSYEGMNFYQSIYQVQCQAGDFDLVEKRYSVKVTASGLENYTDNWDIKLDSMDDYLVPKKELLGSWKVTDAPFEYSVTFKDIDEEERTVTFDYSYYNEKELSWFGYTEVDRSGEDETLYLSTDGELLTDYVKLHIVISEDELSLHPSGVYATDGYDKAYELRKIG